MTDSWFSIIFVAITGFLSTVLSAAIGAYATIKAAELSSKAKHEASQPENKSPGNDVDRQKLVRRTVLILSAITISLCCCFSIFLTWLWFNADSLVNSFN